MTPAPAVPSAPVTASLNLDAFQRDGFAVVDRVIDAARVAELGEAIAALPEGEEVRRRTNVYGIRNLLQVSEATRDLAASQTIRSLVTPVLGADCFAVRATFFDKVAGANWNLRWHQDGVIAVADRVEADGYTAWAQKAGAWQVRPPAGVLARMLAIRVHLDDCPRTNGALHVLAGTHARWWDRDSLDEAKATHTEFVCEAPAGGVVAMRPLTLHASSAAETPRHRRVIHLEFARDELPGRLDWASRVG